MVTYNSNTDEKKKSSLLKNNYIRVPNTKTNIGNNTNIGSNRDRFGTIGLPTPVRPKIGTTTMSKSPTTTPSIARPTTIKTTTPSKTTTTKNVSNNKTVKIPENNNDNRNSNNARQAIQDYINKRKINNFKGRTVTRPGFDEITLPTPVRPKTYIK